MQEWFTARDLAEIAAERGIISFPHTESAAIRRIKREGWDALPAHLSRKRAGRGGGWEYHRSLLSDDIQAALASREERARLAAVQVGETEAERRQVEAIQIAALSPRARGVMEARAEILASIDGYAIAQGERRAWGIGQFVAAQAAWERRCDIEARRDEGLALTEGDVAALRQPLVLSAQSGFGVTPEKLARANDRAGSRRTIARATIYEWFKTRAERGVHALAPAATKAQQPIPAGFAGFLRHYAIGSSPTASDALGEYLKTDPAPELRLTLDQVRYVLRVRMNNIEKHVGREGLLTLRSRLAYVTRTTEDMWPTTIYTADGKTFDAEVLDPVTNRPIRPEITTVLDIVTRKVVGIAISRKENVIAVTEALRNSCVAWGIPAIFYVDRGPGYKNKVFDADVNGLMGRLGITKMHAAPYGSQAKGRIERPNATIWDVLAKRLPSYIGEDMDKEAGQTIHRLSRRDLKEFGSTRLLPSWEDFLRLCADRVAEYNAQPHRSLPRLADEAGRRRHMSPDEAWAAHVAQGFEAVPIDASEVDDLFRPYEIRVASRSLVQIFGNSYFHNALEAYHGERVMVGYDYAQADRVWVREFDPESGQPGRLICVARFGGNAERYVPVSFEQRAIEQRAKGRLLRLDRRRADVEAELSSPYLLEQTPVDPAPFLDAEPVAEPSKPVAEIIPAPRRRVFASDEELAIWALDHRDELTPNQIRVLRDALMSPAHCDLFRMSGIDLEALRALIRGAA